MCGDFLMIGKIGEPLSGCLKKCQQYCNDYRASDSGKWNERLSKRSGNIQEKRGKGAVILSEAWGNSKKTSFILLNPFAYN